MYTLPFWVLFFISFRVSNSQPCGTLTPHESKDCYKQNPKRQCIQKQSPWEIKSMKLHYSGDQRATKGGTQGRMPIPPALEKCRAEQGVGGSHPQLRMAVAVLALRSPTLASAGASSTSLHLEHYKSGSVHTAFWV